MKATPAPTAATIRTADTARGMRCRSSKPAAGDSMVPTTNAVDHGKKESLGGIEHDDDADDEQRHQGERNHFRAADDRRLFGFAVGQGRTGRLDGKDAHSLSPALRT